MTSVSGFIVRGVLAKLCAGWGAVQQGWNPANQQQIPQRLDQENLLPKEHHENLLPKEHVTAGNLRDASSFGCVSSVVGHCPDFSVSCGCLASAGGMVWEYSNSLVQPSFQKNENVLDKSCLQYRMSQNCGVTAWHPHLWCDF